MLKLISSAGLAALAVVTVTASAEAANRHHRQQVDPSAIAYDEGDRPLTIRPHDHPGIIRRGNDIIAPGGFSAHGYGYPAATAQDKKEAYNAYLRNAGRLYGSGVDGLGGWGFDNDPEAGYNNPYYGNTFSSYTGYNGVPTNLAFGPGFANRYIADHDPNDDDDNPGPPSPADLGFQTE